MEAELLKHPELLQTLPRLSTREEALLYFALTQIGHKLEKAAFMKVPANKEHVLKTKLFHIFENGTRRFLDTHAERKVQMSPVNGALRSLYKVNFVADRGEDRIAISVLPPEELQTHPALIGIESAHIILRRRNGLVTLEEHGGHTTNYVFIRHNQHLPSNWHPRVESALGIIDQAIKQ